MRYALYEESRPGGRPTNQDRTAHWTQGEALLLGLADGLGGHGNGEVAAQIALDTIGGLFAEAAAPRVARPEAFLVGAIDAAHAAILRHAAQAGYTQTPGTTLVACLVQDGHAWWSFVGDSRLYLVRAGRVAARTRDHTHVQRLIDAGRMREEAAMVHPERHKLLQCLGAPTPPRAEPVASAPLERGDLLLMCSDGLWSPLTPRQLLVGLIGDAPAVALPRLIRLAEARAGRDCDNISVIALRWNAPAREAPSARRAGPGDTIRERLAFGKS